MPPKIILSICGIVILTLLSACNKIKCVDPTPVTPSDTTKKQPVTVITPVDTTTTVTDTSVTTPPVTSGVSNLSSATFPSLFNVNFLDPLSGYISGANGFVSRTTDGGASWTNVSPNSTADFYGLYFQSTSKGFIGSHSGSTVLRTLDGGTSWTQITGINNAFNYGSFTFIDQDTGYAAGGQASTTGNVTKTIDGGTTWVDLPIAGLSSVYDVFFINQTGFTCGYNNQIFKTTDGGYSWHQANINFISSPVSIILLDKILFTKTGVGYCVGYGTSFEANYILKSMDGGETWNQIPSPPQTYSSADAYTSMFVTDSDEVYIIGGNVQQNTETFIKSADGGVTWTNVPNSAVNRLYKSCYIQGVSYIVGLNGTLLKSSE